MTRAAEHKKWRSLAVLALQVGHFQSSLEDPQGGLEPKTSQSPLLSNGTMGTLPPPLRFGRPPYVGPWAGKEAWNGENLKTVPILPFLQINFQR